MVSLACRIIFVALSLFTLARVGLFALYHDSSFQNLSPGLVGLGFLRGLRFDLSAALTFLALPLLMLMITVPERMASLWRRLAVWLAFAITSSLVAMLVADLLYFRYVDRHMSDEVLTMGQDLNLVRQLVLETYAQVTIALAFACVLSGWQWRRFAWAPAQNSSSQRKSLAARVGFVVLLALLIRGSLGLKPLAPVDAFRSEYSAEGHLALNGVFTAWHASVNQNSKPAALLPSPEIRTRVLLSLGQDPNAPQPFLRSQVTTPLTSKTKPNIVLILLESWGAFYVDSFGGQNFGATPNFDRIAARGIRFHHFYANGSRSIEAIQAVLSSFPALSGLPTIGQGFEQMNTPRLGQVMRQNGYRTLFFQSAARRSFRLDSVAAAMGFEEYYGGEDHPPRLDYGKEPPPMFGWDYETFMHMADKLETSSPPFMAMVFTGTTHTPFARPPQPLFPKTHGPDSEPGFLNTIAYADWSLGEFFARAEKAPWFANTIFILTADHAFPAYREFPFVDHYRVPLVIFSSESMPPNEKSLVGSHLDIFPTIVDLAGISQAMPFAGRSLMREDDHDSFAILGGRYGNPAVITESAYLQHSLQQRLETKVFDPRCTPECLDKMEERLLTLSALFSDLIHKNLWNPK